MTIVFNWNYGYEYVLVQSIASAGWSMACFSRQLLGNAYSYHETIECPTIFFRHYRPVSQSSDYSKECGGHHEASFAWAKTAHKKPTSASVGQYIYNCISVHSHEDWRIWVSRSKMRQPSYGHPSTRQPGILYYTMKLAGFATCTFKQIARTRSMYKRNSEACHCLPLMGQPPHVSLALMWYTILLLIYIHTYIEIILIIFIYWGWPLGLQQHARSISMKESTPPLIN